jgi:hypothetical protein
MTPIPTIETTRSQGRPIGSTRQHITPAALLSDLTTRIGKLIGTQVTTIEKTLRKLDDAAEVNPEITHSHVTARIELTENLAGMMKTLMQVQVLRTRTSEDEEIDDGVSGTGEEIVRALMGGGKKNS